MMDVPFRAAALPLLALLASSTLPCAPARADAIEDKAQVCASCHGEAGLPIDKSYPLIWGQHQGYLYLQLRDFKLGQRKNEIMNGIAQDMSRDDMMGLAEYFSKKTWVNLNQPRATPDEGKRAEAAITAGQCGSCHGAQGMGDGTNPRIAGQRREYILKTLQDFRSRTRTNNPWMSDITNTLAPEDLDALASYMAGR
jgi:cytochrome c553